MLERGLVQIYTGQGKGKTTAAFGLALRAAGHGARVLIYQFLKPADLVLGERELILSRIEGITLRYLDEPWDMFASMHDQAQIERIRKAVHEALLDLDTAAHDKFYDLIVLDEIVFCLQEGLASMDDVRRLIQIRDPHVELVLTGRGATQELIDLADLVTEMRPIKHPYDKGISARKGIEY
ncbi:MAG: cob(I)yrinic acid a,c-diamide adenosyltransferase [Planctomycetaceae bacterium]|nr:cob(I)yrinic acid a,c-diamide adenosyltransferase [Planctomycetaceae bacterium]